MLMSQATHKQNPTNAQVSKANEVQQGQLGEQYVAATDNGISAALGSLDTARHPSTKDMPKTANGLAYTTGL